MGTVSARTRLIQTKNRIAELEEKVKTESLATIKNEIQKLKEVGIEATFYLRNGANVDTNESVKVRRPNMVLTPEHKAKLLAGRQKYHMNAKQANNLLKTNH